MSDDVRRSRVTIDLPCDVERKLRWVAARRGVSLRRYVLDTITERVKRDWAEAVQYEGLLAMTAESDPVLGDLWDNERDAAYDTV